MRLHHIAVQTKDIRRAIAFYQAIFDATIIGDIHVFKARELAFISIGNTTLELYSARKDEMLLEWHDKFPGPVHLAFEVADLDKFLANALLNGAEFHRDHPEPFVPTQGGPKIAYLCGPDFEEIEIRQRVSP